MHGELTESGGAEHVRVTQYDPSHRQEADTVYGGKIAFLRGASGYSQDTLQVTCGRERQQQRTQQRIY